MNKSRRLLTLIALVSFVVILLVIGNNQTPYSNMQIEWGRGRVWGLTPLGNALIILLVVYLGLFAILNNDGLHQFLIRWSRAIKRVVLGLIIVAIIEPSRKLRRRGIYTERWRALCLLVMGLLRSW
jgi:hypothetical protein